MKLSLSWIDPLDLRARLEAVSEPPLTVLPQLVSQASGQRATRPRQATPAALRASPHPFLAGEGNLSQRLNVLIDWLRSQTQAQAVFICDDDCLVLAQWSSTPELAAAATWLAVIWNNVGPRLHPSGRGTVAAELEDDAWLLLLSESATWGRAYLGISLNQLAGPLTMRAMQDALSSALKEK